MTKVLHEQKLLADEFEIRNYLDEFRSILDHTFRAVIMPTEGCNFRCPYCYENHIPATMTRHLFEQILTYISDQCIKFNHIIISWFGGESTLCADSVLEASSFIQELQKIYEFRYQSDMTTNGYLLDEKLFRKLYVAGVTQYQITIDGKNHDKTRPHVSGKGTLDVIMKNVASITRLPKKMNFEITIRHNILSGDENFEWYDSLAKIVGDDNRFSILVRPVGDWGGDSVKKLNICSKSEQRELVKRHIDYLNKIGLQCSNQFQQSFSNVCYANYPNALVFRSNGRIEKCTVALDHPKNQIGYVDPIQGVVLIPENESVWGFHGYRKECASCTKVTSCLNMKCNKNLVIDGLDNDVCGECTVHSFLT